MSIDHLKKRILLFGGSFDPIHWGHLKTVQCVQETFHFDQVIFIPCKLSPLKDQTYASAQDRLNMLQLGIKELNNSVDYIIDDFELQRPAPSYTINTLIHYRQTYNSTTSITFLLGLDSYLQLPQWHNWLELFEYANLLVINRPKVVLNQELQLPAELLTTDMIHNGQLYFQHTHGEIHWFDAGNYNISASEIRQAITQGTIDQITTLPPSIKNYIFHPHKYKL